MSIYEGKHTALSVGPDVFVSLYVCAMLVFMF